MDEAVFERAFGKTKISDFTLDRGRLASVFLWLYLVFAIGFVWNCRPNMSPNDNARWNTAWSLTEYGTFEIFDTPEAAKANNKPQQLGTIDKIITKDNKTYATKPPLLPLMMAGWWKLIRPIVGPVSIDPASTALPPGANSADVRTLDGVTLGTFHIYSKTTLILFQLLPMFGCLWLWTRWLNRHAEDEFTWLYLLIVFGLALPAVGYLSTLNNHSIGFAAGFAGFYHVLRIVYENERQAWRFALAGLFMGLMGMMELPSVMLIGVSGLMLLAADWKKTLLLFTPMVALVVGAAVYANILALGTWKPAYVQRELYEYPGSYWAKENAHKMSKIDALNFAKELGHEPEPTWLYLVHMTIGHHGVFSMTPIWLFALWAFLVRLVKRPERYPHLHWPIALMTLINLLFFILPREKHNIGGFEFTFGNDQRNYGGFCHGPRWLMWTGLMWIFLLPETIDHCRRSRFCRLLAWIFLAISILSVADTLYNPWNRSWLHRIMWWFGVIDY